jgi:hypothetical protein
MWLQKQTVAAPASALQQMQGISQDSMQQRCGSGIQAWPLQMV